MDSLALKNEDAYSYALITSACNEQDFLPATIESVIGQSVIPRKWVIASDGSTDRTDTIIREYSVRFPFIEYLRLEKENRKVGFASKVHALNEAYRHIGQTDCEFLGILDADITFESGEYFKKLMRQFHTDQRLGISGGAIYEVRNGRFRERDFNNVDSVAGAVQFFRWKCFEEIGCLQPIETGGEDWIAEISARSKGWNVITALDLVVYHHKKGNDVRGWVREGIRQGKMDYLLGSHPLFEILKCASRVKEKPYLVKAVIRGTTYLFMAITGRERFATKEIREQLIKEQISRMKQLK